MNDGGAALMNLIIACVFGGICASIASSKGRNAVGWFFIGFFFSCIGLLIIICLSNLLEEKAALNMMEIQHRRLREQLRQEQMKNEALRQHAVARLDLHDEKLGMNTRLSAPPLDPPGTPSLHRLHRPPIPSAPPPGLPANGWFTNENGEQHGPFAFQLLLNRASQGTLDPETPVWVEPMVDWKPARQIPNLFPS
jgi:hypothetical protein